MLYYSIQHLGRRLCKRRRPARGGGGGSSCRRDFGGLLGSVVGAGRGILVVGGLFELVWFVLVIFNRHRDPLWLGLCCSAIASPLLLLLALASGFRCDNDPYCHADPAPLVVGFEISLLVAVILAVAIVTRAVARRGRDRGRTNGCGSRTRSP